MMNLQKLVAQTTPTTQCNAGDKIGLKKLSLARPVRHVRRILFPVATQSDLRRSRETAYIFNQQASNE